MRKLAIILACILILTSVVGCAGDPTPADSAPPAQAPADTPADAPADAPVEAPDEPDEQPARPTEHIPSSTAPAADVVTGDEIRIGVSMPIRGEAVWEAYLQGIIDGAEALGNVTLIIQSAQNNATEQLQQIENFIAQKVDGVVGAYVDNMAILEAIQKLNDAGIPYVTFARGLPADPGVDVAYHVSAEVIGMMDQMNEWLVDYAREAGRKLTVIELMGALNDSYAIDQRDKLAETAANHPDLIEIVAQIPGDWNAELGLSGMQNALEANPDVDVIYSHSEFYTAAIRSALTQAGRFVRDGEPGYVVHITSGGDLASMELLRDGYLSVVGCFAAYDVGIYTSNAVVAILQGKTLEGTVYEPPAFLVDANNYDELGHLAYGMIGQ